MTEQVHSDLRQHQLATQPFKQGHAQIGLKRQDLPDNVGCVRPSWRAAADRDPAAAVT